MLPEKGAEGSGMMQVMSDADKDGETVAGTVKWFDPTKGFGFVDMPRPAARSAVDGLHGTKMGGRDLTVRLAKPRTHSR